MRGLMMGLALLAFTPTLALAQLERLPHLERRAIPPAPSSTCDVQSGNCYYTQRRQDGSSSTQGSNPQTGALWQSQTDQNGLQSGMDAKGNYWTYDPRTGAYTNTNGHTCVGLGDARVCS